MLNSVAVQAANAPAQPSLHGPHDQPYRAQLRAIESGDYLYVQSQVRGFAFKVERGAVAIFRRNIQRPSEIIEIAVAGDVIGLGVLERHADNAKAVVDCIVSILPGAEVDALALHDPKLRQRQSEAIEREFENRKEFLVARNRGNPLGRVAAFLLFASSQNAGEGRDPMIISESLCCGSVSQHLGMDVDTLFDILVELEHLSLIEQTPASGLRLIDLDGLERVSDGLCAGPAHLDGR